MLYSNGQQVVKETFLGFLDGRLVQGRVKVYLNVDKVWNEFVQKCVVNVRENI